MLRREIYAQDADPHSTPSQLQRSLIPYTTTEQNSTVWTLQPRGVNRHAVFFTHPRESVSCYYERTLGHSGEPADPRIQHSITLEVDKYGNVLKHASIGYGRRMLDAIGRGRPEPAGGGPY